MRAGGRTSDELMGLSVTDQSTIDFSGFLFPESNMEMAWQGIGGAAAWLGPLYAQAPRPDVLVACPQRRLADMSAAPKPAA